MRRALLDVMENLEWSPGMWQCNEKAPACMLLVRYYRYIAKHKVHIYIHLSYLAYILLESPKRLEREAKCLYTCDNLGVQGMRLVDHSGLGAANRMTADAMVGALVKVYDSNVLRPILKSIPVRDDSRKVIENSAIKTDAKTGTLNFVSGLGGYMTTPDGTVLAFATFTGNEKIRARISKADREAPKGAKTYNNRSKKLQQKLIARWGAVHSS